MPKVLNKKAPKKRAVKKTAKPRKISKSSYRKQWLKHYLNKSNYVTFMNQEESAIAAGYKETEHNIRTQGYENKKYWQKEISKWMDEECLSEDALKQKMASLLEAQDTKLFVIDGQITEHKIPALETQRKTMEFACRSKGMDAPIKHEITTGKDTTWTINVVSPDSSRDDEN